VASTLRKIAADLDVDVRAALDACARLRISAFGPDTPVDDDEEAKVRALMLGQPLPGSTPAFGTAPGGAPPPPPAFGAPQPGAGLPPPPPPGVGYGTPVPRGAPGSKPRGRAIVGIVVGVLVLGIVGLAAIVFLAGDDEDLPSNAEEAGQQLVVGDCFDEQNRESNPTEIYTAFVDEKRCSSPHDAEVYALLTHPGGPDAPFPGDDAVVEYTLDQCVARFEEFVGRDYESSSLDVIYLFPRELSWSKLDDRRIVCAVYDLSGEPLEGSVRGLGL
jgi:hypothetical protein